jgi:hypothetical protein
MTWQAEIERLYFRAEPRKQACSFVTCRKQKGCPRSILADGGFPDSARIFPSSSTAMFTATKLRSQQTRRPPAVAHRIAVQSRRHGLSGGNFSIGHATKM